MAATTTIAQASEKVAPSFDAPADTRVAADATRVAADATVPAEVDSGGARSPDDSNQTTTTNNSTTSSSSARASPIASLALPPPPSNGRGRGGVVAAVVLVALALAGAGVYAFRRHTQFSARAAFLANLEGANTQATLGKASTLRSYGGKIPSSRSGASAIPTTAEMAVDSNTCSSTGTEVGNLEVNRRTGGGSLPTGNGEDGYSQPLAHYALQRGTSAGPSDAGSSTAGPLYAIPFEEGGGSGASLYSIPVDGMGGAGGLTGRIILDEAGYIVDSNISNYGGGAPEYAEPTYAAPVDDDESSSAA